MYTRITGLQKTKVSLKKNSALPEKNGLKSCTETTGTVQKRLDSRNGYDAL